MNVRQDLVESLTYHEVSRFGTKLEPAAKLLDATDVF
jgi:hypothetical protein